MGALHTFKKSIASEGKSTRRPEPLIDADYDHEIQLIDHSSPLPPISQAPSNLDNELSPISSSNSRTSLQKKTTLQKEIAHQTLLKSKQGAGELEDTHNTQNSSTKTSTPTDSKTPLIENETSHQDSDLPFKPTTTSGTNEEERGRQGSRSYGSTKLHKKERHEDPTSHIDILYENQRGCFLCGMPLFSRRALGNLDPPPWTNEFHKPSPTDTANAQVPDPSWQWAWKEWRINHDVIDDGNGFEYSFAFARFFSWHNPSWWNSFVRRRAWIRKRVKKHEEHPVQESHKLNAQYFTIHPNRDQSRSSRGSSVGKARYSITDLARREMEREAEKEDITSIQQLLEVLKLCRIDREKMEAVENFVQHGGDDLYYLREKMHEIMAQFIFQVSRRILLAHLLQIFDEASSHRKMHEQEEKEENDEEKRRIDNLQAAIKHAEEEVQRLEFWSDVKDMVEKGETVNAADEEKNWGDGWQGLDNSAPKDVISDRESKQGNRRDGSKGKSKVSWMSSLETYVTPPERRETPDEKGKGKGKGKGKSKA